MEFIRSSELAGWVNCKDDPELWLQLFYSDQRLDIPTRYILSIDGRKICLSCAMHNRVKPIGGPTQHDFDRPTMTIRQLGVDVSGISRTDRVATNVSKFASREQQERAIEFFLGAAKQMKPIKHVTGEISHPQARFAPEVWAALERGDFIE